MTCFKTEYPSPVGLLTLASDGVSLIGLWMEGQKYFGGAVSGEMIRKDELPIFAETKAWLDAYFAGERPSVDTLKLAPIGGEFRQRVWKLLLEIPYGRVVTYGDIAKKLGTGCAQAVGGAVGHNPIGIIIPCHRVVGAGSRLTGYAGGVERKIRLLELEGIDIGRLT